MARARALLLGMLRLIQNGSGDVVGVLLRALYETWVYGTLGLVGTDQDLVDLRASRDYWIADLERKAGFVNPDWPHLDRLIWPHPRAGSRTALSVGF